MACFGRVELPPLNGFITSGLGFRFGGLRGVGFEV